MDCQICGEEKDYKEFFRTKTFTKMFREKVQWCKECQRAYIEMVRKQKADELKKLMAGTFRVKFE